MRRLRHGLIVAVLAATVLAGNVWTASADDDRTHRVGGAPAPSSMLAVARTSDREAADTVASAPPVEVAAQTQEPLVARVVKPFGASIRVAPSLDAPVLLSTRCGDLWPVTSLGDGWVAVMTADGNGWIGGGRVVVGTVPAEALCGGARFLPEGSNATVQAPRATGCLPLRHRPSAEAPTVACVETGHTYTVLDGPLDPSPGEDWFRVSSPTTGTGWAFADALYPAWTPAATVPRAAAMGALPVAARAATYNRHHLQAGGLP